MLPRFLFPATDKVLTAEAAAAIVKKHETAEADERRELAKAEST